MRIETATNAGKIGQNMPQTAPKMKIKIVVRINKERNSKNPCENEAWLSEGRGGGSGGALPPRTSAKFSSSSKERGGEARAHNPVKR